MSVIIFTVYDYIVKSKKLGASFWRGEETYSDEGQVSQNEEKTLNNKEETSLLNEEEPVVNEVNNEESSQIQFYGEYYSTPLNTEDAMWVLIDYLTYEEDKIDIITNYEGEIDHIKIFSIGWTEVNEISGAKNHIIGKLYSVNCDTGEVNEYEGDLP
ncbi:hypothetical protein [Niallia sp. FSL R7-0271]|uniref:hypothetical protein n=1 Tax=Niallia sp. FSL R7-0271 TaxID=2921678 RepID=UPI0030FCF5E8